jgi:hypothetical protein
MRIATTTERGVAVVYSKMFNLKLYSNPRLSLEKAIAYGIVEAIDDSRMI